MEQLAIGLWGCFYGGSLLVVCGAAYAYARSMRRIGLNAGLSAVVPAFAAAVFLGALPIDDKDIFLRLLAQLTALVSALLVYQLLNIFRWLDTPQSRSRTRILFVVIGTAAIGLSWALAPASAFLTGAVLAVALAVCAFGVALRVAIRGDSHAWLTVLAIAAVAVCYSGLSYSVLQPDQWSWGLQAVSAAAASAYVVALAGINLRRYAYLLESKKAMEYGPAYDPITRLRSRSETDHMAREIFDKLPHNTEPLGVIVLTIANLFSLEKLHGMAAVNSALFLTAGRLKRSLPAKVELGRLGFDGFLLIMRNCTDSGRLVSLAHDLNHRLHKSATLNTSPAAQELESAHTLWTAQVGIGVLHVKNLETSSFDAITIGRNMSRVAISYPSRVAWFDHASGEMTELPAHPGMV